MRYHYEKPTIYLSMYGKRYICDHPVYDSCTLFEIGDKGLAVIQQRYLQLIPPNGNTVELNGYFKDGPDGMVRIEQAEYEERKARRIDKK